MERLETSEKLAINVDEFAAKLGISRPIAYRLCHKEGFPAVFISERRIVIPIEPLNEWLAKNAGSLGM